MLKNLHVRALAYHKEEKPKKYLLDLLKSQFKGVVKESGKLISLLSPFLNASQESHITHK